MHGTLSDQSLIYLQIAQMLEDDILRGVYREEEQVPSTNELSRVYHINPATAAKGSTSSRRRGSCISAGASACSWLRGRSRPCGPSGKRRFTTAMCGPW